MSLPDVLPAFVPGVRLSAHFFEDAVKPLLDQHFPGLACDAALLDSGSEVLGLDDAGSTTAAPSR